MLALIAAAWADEPDPIVLNVPIVEAPDVWGDGVPGWPSLDQGNDLVGAADRLLTGGIQRGMYAAFPNKEGLRLGLGLPAVGVVTVGTVYLGSWAHEEAHRAVLRNRGITSRNGIYYPEAWSNGTISVDHVSDADLTRLKAEYPADLVRLMSVGIETQILLVREQGDQSFLDERVGRRLGPFYLANTWMAPPLLAETASTILYYARCQGEDSDAVTDAENRVRLAEEDRDFTGLDCTAWVYDMRRPDEPYAARGSHPYGEGIDRYRSYEDLTEEERSWLEGQFFLNLLNLANPHLYGIDGVMLPGGGRWIVGLGHLPTPWGYQLDARGAVRLDRVHLAVELHAGFAEHGFYPGFDAAWYDAVHSGRAALDVGVGGWLQPAEQRWDATRAAPGGRAWAHARFALADAVAIQPGLEVKSAGFVPGNVHLDPSISGDLAVRLTIP